jgi:uncharacterized protein YukE
MDTLPAFMLLPLEFPERFAVSLKCEINRYGRRLAKAFADQQQQDDMEKFYQAIEQLAEEVERNEHRLALAEQAVQELQRLKDGQPA